MVRPCGPTRILHKRSLQPCRLVLVHPVWEEECWHPLREELLVQTVKGRDKWEESVRLYLWVPPEPSKLISTTQTESSQEDPAPQVPSSQADQVPNTAQAPEVPFQEGQALLLLLAPPITTFKEEILSESLDDLDLQFFRDYDSALGDPKLFELTEQEQEEQDSPESFKVTPKAHFPVSVKDLKVLT